MIEAQAWSFHSNFIGSPGGNDKNKIKKNREPKVTFRQGVAQKGVKLTEGDKDGTEGQTKKTKSIKKQSDKRGGGNLNSISLADPSVPQKKFTRTIHHPHFPP